MKSLLIRQKLEHDIKHLSIFCKYETFFKQCFIVIHIYIYIYIYAEREKREREKEREVWQGDNVKIRESKRTTTQRVRASLIAKVFGLVWFAWVWLGWVLWHINPCCPFNNKSPLHIYSKYMICQHILLITF